MNDKKGGKKSLNPQQQVAANPDKNVVVSAGAGTGKTTVLSERFVKFAERIPAGKVKDSLSAVVSITFTNEAAGQMRERIYQKVFEKYLQADNREKAHWFKVYRNVDSAQISTIHSLCRTLLARFPLEAGVSPTFTVDNEEIKPDDYLEEFFSHCLRGEEPLAEEVRDEDLAQIFTGLLDTTGKKFPVSKEILKDVLSKLYDNRNFAGRNVRELARETPEKVAEKYRQLLARLNVLSEVDEEEIRFFAEYAVGIAKLYTEFEQFLRRNYRAVSTVDFNGLLIYALNLIRRFQEEKPDYFEKISPKMLMVDEFQDTSPIQWELISAIAEKAGTVMFVGDEKQSIYKFRGADVTVVRTAEEFIRRRANSEVVVLETNYRSTGELLEIINAVFRDVFSGAEKPYEARFQELKPAEDNIGKTGRIFVVEPRIQIETGNPTEGQSAELLSVIKHLLVDEGRSPGEIMVLTLKNNVVAQIVKLLRENGIPAIPLGGKGFWGNPETKFFVHLFNFLTEPRDTAALFSLLRDGFGIEPRHIFRFLAMDKFLSGELTEKERENMGFLWYRLEKFACDNDSLSSEEGRQLVEVYKILNELREYSSRYGIFDTALKALSFPGVLAKLIESAPEVKWLNIQKLLGILANYQNAGLPLETAVEMINAEKDANARGPAYPVDTANFVRVSTIHSAKGLEAPVVVIVDGGRGGSQSKGDVFFDSEIPGNFIPKLASNRDSAFLRAINENLLKPKDKAEQKRLAYVAITRAKEKVFIIPLLARNLRMNSTILKTLSGRAKYSKQKDTLEGLPEGFGVFTPEWFPDEESELLLGKSPGRKYTKQISTGKISPARVEISATHLAEFIACPMYFHLKYGEGRGSVRFRSAPAKSGAKQFGSLVHRFAALLPMIPFDDLKDKIHTAVPDAELAEKLISALKQLLNTGLFPTDEPTFTEVPIHFAENGIIITGQADLIIGNTIYDFKTGERDNFTLRVYSAQLDLYRRGTARSLGVPPEKIKTAIVWVDTNSARVEFSTPLPDTDEKIALFRQYAADKNLPLPHTAELCFFCEYKKVCHPEGDK